MKVKSVPIFSFFYLCLSLVSSTDFNPIIFGKSFNNNDIQNLDSSFLVPGDGGSQLEARLNKTTAVHYLCQKTTKDFFSLWLNMELLVPVVIDCWVS